MTIINKDEKYQAVITKLREVLEPTEDNYVKMITISSILKYELPYYFRVGFYLVAAPKLLKVGPYQGTIGCIKIPFDKGVCGACASQEKTIIVPDVHKFPGHIACDSRSNSEIVVPIFGKDGKLMAVLDVDSTEHDSFDETDQKYLEQILVEYFG